VPASLQDVRIDEATWSTGSHARRLEWRTAVRDLLDSHYFNIDAPPFSLDLTWHADASAELVARAGDEELCALYVGICREMVTLGSNPNSPKLEAFDIAKRISHDEGGETVCELCRPLRPDHGTGRRLFTLLVTLHTDTTIMIIPQHRGSRRRRDERG
jgi:uncharacterized protein (UPF0262 family)